MCFQISSFKFHAVSGTVRPAGPRFHAKSRTRRSSLLGVFIIALILVAVAAPGRVFRRWSSATQSTRALEAVGGAIAYEAPVVVNEGKGALVILGFESPAEDVARTLARVFKLDSLVFAGGAMGFATASSDGVTLRLLLLQLPGQSMTLVFKIEQTAEEARRSAAPPARHLLDALPAYAPSEPALFLRDEGTGFSLASARTRSSPAAVLEFYRNRLPRLGWTPALAPRTADGTTPTRSSLLVFHRGPNLCCVYAEAAAESGETRITLLHKQQAMK
ncbi:MAG: hypothetical protein QME60_06035 [Verrucomicrobiota bacterium]|nr:hypothetical protein [Verrucomicrobiota bacterium]